jgi:RNA polymerase sigma factor (sigma-70 family)
MLTYTEAETLFHDNIALAYFARNRYGWMFAGCREIAPEDVDQICLMALWTAALRFDLARGCCFSTYAVSTVYGAMRKALRAAIRRNRLPTVPLDSVAVDRPDNEDECARNVPDPEDLEEAVCDSAAYSGFIESLSELTRRVIACRASGMGQAEIGRAIGLSQVHVSRLIRQAAKQYAALRT